MDHYNVFRTIITWTMVAVMLPWSYFVFDGTTEQRFYDTAGNLTCSVDAAEQETTYTYDAYDRLVSTQDELGTTEYVYYSKTCRIMQGRGMLPLPCFRAGTECRRMICSKCYGFPKSKDRIDRKSFRLGGTLYEHFDLYGERKVGAILSFSGEGAV